MFTGKDPLFEYDSLDERYPAEISLERLKRNTKLLQTEVLLCIHLNAFTQTWESVRTSNIMASKSIDVNRRKSPCVLQETNVVYVFVLGNKECGKSSLIRALITNEVKDSNLPSLTVFESRELLSRSLFILRFCELSEETVRLEEVKQTCQQQKTVLFFCFAIDDINSLHTIIQNWIVPLNNTIGIQLPSILVGNKKDLRHHSEEGKHIIESSWGEQMMKCFGFQHYHECSVLKKQSVADLFYIAVGLAMKTDLFS
ncbi:hypothetical protein CDAR_224361 [Caerostris darwini]|uniref:Uncharacterized protein n=1 Tax=Caerostris darwini TaxID=1538125 RepID=A0AAV4WYG6_9ARAC|nr:hypothetical protein CDAR_224361 [Caerostris darwini]